MSLTNLAELDVLSLLRRKPDAPAEKPAAEKQAFTPAPAVAQAVMAQAQGGDPSMGAGGMPPGGMPPGPPPGPDAGLPPGAAPAPPPEAQAAPPQDAGPSPVEAKLDQLLQLMQQQQQAGAAGPNGKPATASVKIDPAHFQQVVHKITVMESIMRQLADGMGLQVPAGELFDMQPPVTPPGQPAPAPAPAGPAPSNIAQQLPSLPPVASKAAATPVAGLSKLAGPGVADLARIDSGTAVDPVNEPEQAQPTNRVAGILGRLYGRN